MKSRECSGMKFNCVCVPWNSPRPNHSPLPTAIFDWFKL